jgi:hypothetical protein
MALKYLRCKNFHITRLQKTTLGKKQFTSDTFTTAETTHSCNWKPIERYYSGGVKFCAYAPNVAGCIFLALLAN